MRRPTWFERLLGGLGLLLAVPTLLPMGLLTSLAGRIAQRREQGRSHPLSRPLLWLLLPFVLFFYLLAVLVFLPFKLLIPVLMRLGWIRASHDVVTIDGQVADVEINVSQLRLARGADLFARLVSAAQDEAGAPEGLIYRYHPEHDLVTGPVWNQGPELVARAGAVVGEIDDWSRQHNVWVFLDDGDAAHGDIQALKALLARAADGDVFALEEAHQSTNALVSLAATYWIEQGDLNVEIEITTSPELHQAILARYAGVLGEHGEEGLEIVEPEQYF